VRCIAHRGGSLEAPENTLHAFRRAVAAGADMLELDLRATHDGEVVVLHDPFVDRVTDGTGAIADLALGEVRDLDAAHWFAPGAGATREADGYPLRRPASGGAVDPELRIPTLAEVLAAVPDLPLTVDLKVGPPEVDWFPQAVAGLLRAAGRAEDVVVGSFSSERLGAFRGAAPDVPTSASQEEVARFWSGAPLDVPGLVALQVPAIYEGVAVVTGDFVERAHGADLEVHVWTVDDPADMRRLVDLGVDGLISDRPTLLAEVLSARAG
jgi:glycerophosphoryl diester phosphodiesterase